MKIKIDLDLPEKVLISLVKEAMWKISATYNVIRLSKDVDDFLTVEGEYDEQG